MKLYTEEQVTRLVINMSPRYMIKRQIQDIIAEQVTPIELPSAEDIANKAGILFTLDEQESFIDGAKWMKEQILGKEDKTFKQKSKWTEVDNMTRRLK